MPIPSTLRLGLVGLGALSRRPDLWVSAAGSARTLVPPQWWKRRPFLPVPDRQWLKFRLVTAYGGDGAFSGSAGDGAIRAEDIITWLEWRKTFPR